MAIVFNTYMDANNDIHKLVLFGLECIRETDMLLEKNFHCYRFPAADSDRMIELSHRVAQTTTTLIQHYHPHIALFHYTIKQHYTLHLALCTKWTNPMHGTAQVEKVT